MEDERTQFVPIVLDNGAVLKIEARELGGREKVGVLDAQPIGQLLESIEAIAASFGATVKRIAPHRAAVEFGVEVGVESGRLIALICKGSGKANLTITLEWSEGPNSPTPR
jgi:hypothetical protein